MTLAQVTSNIKRSATMAYVATVAKNKAGRAAAITGLACVAIFANSGSALAQAPTERIVTAPPAAQILRAQPRGNLLAARPMVGPPAATTTAEPRIDLAIKSTDSKIFNPPTGTYAAVRSRSNRDA